MYDVVIRGGSVVDGTGAPARRADIGIQGDRVRTIGIIDDDGDAEVIDAEGLTVAPGFVDVHTHYDAQVFWDSTLSPSPLHGVTTVISGNCGFTIAPLSTDPRDGEYLMKMLARVEGMPLESLEQGVPWNWTTFGEYLDSFAGTLSINAGFKVGHSALRRVVMGEEATSGPAAPDQIEAMRDLLRESLAAGGLGFSSSWARTHNDAAGNMVPSRHAEPDKLIALCAVAGEFPGTSLEFLPMVGPFDDTAFDLMADMSAAAQRPLNWNLLAVSAKTLDAAWHQLEGGQRASERGGKVVGLTIPMAMGLRLSFLTGFVLDALPGWEEAMALPLDEKKALLADPAARRRLDEQAQTDHPLRAIAHWSTKVITECFSDETKPYEGRVVGDIAEELGKEPFDTLVDIALADDLMTAFALPERSEGRDDWEARAKVWRDGRAVIGASDAGAHLDLLGTFNYSTHVLATAVREYDVVSLEEAVHLITQVPAELYGLIDRGVLTEGAYADIVVFDPETIGPGPLRTRFDLPGGAGRIFGEADGVHRVLVNGVEIVDDGAFTDARPGTVLRSGRDTVTPVLD